MSRRGRPPHPDVLTPHEWEALALLREGLTDQAIADRLDISLDGAKYHVREILSKLGVASRQEAAAWQPEAPAPARRWLVLPVALRIAGAMVMLATVGGLGLLAWGVVRTSDSPDDAFVEPTPSEVSADCKDGTPTHLDGRPACSFAFEATDVPARLQGFPLQINPPSADMFGDVVLRATCTPEASCLSMATGDPVTEDQTSQIDWRIVEPATIVIIAPETVETERTPVRKYHLVNLRYDHPADRICTGEFLYCYDFIANYERIE